MGATVWSPIQEASTSLNVSTHITAPPPPRYPAAAKALIGVAVIGGGVSTGRGLDAVSAGLRFRIASFSLFKSARCPKTLAFAAP